MRLVRLSLVTLFLLVIVSPALGDRYCNKEGIDKYNKAISVISKSYKEVLLKESISLCPTNYDAYVELINLYLSENKEQHALKVANRVLPYADANTRLRIYKSFYRYYYVTKIDNPDIKKAAYWLSKIVTIEDNFLNNYYLGRLNGPRGLKRYRLSISYYLKALAKRPNQLDIYYKIAENYFYLKQYNKTIEYLLKYPSTKSKRSAFRMLVISLFKVNSPQAIEVANEYLENWPYDNYVISLKGGTSTNQFTAKIIPINLEYYVKQRFKIELPYTAEIYKLNISALWESLKSSPADNYVEVKVYPTFPGNVSELLFNDYVQVGQQEIVLERPTNLTTLIVEILYKVE